MISGRFGLADGAGRLNSVQLLCDVEVSDAIFMFFYTNYVVYRKSKSLFSFLHNMILMEQSKKKIQRYFYCNDAQILVAWQTFCDISVSFFFVVNMSGDRMFSSESSSDSEDEDVRPSRPKKTFKTVKLIGRKGYGGPSNFSTTSSSSASSRYIHTFISRKNKYFYNEF